MKEQSTERLIESRPLWEDVEAFARQRIPFAAVRLCTAVANRYKKVENATAVIWQTLVIAERTFRRLDAPELLVEVAEGVTFVDGVRMKRTQSPAEKQAAA